MLPKCNFILPLRALPYTKHRVTTHLENRKKSENWILVREMEKVRESYNHHLAAAREKDIK